MLRACDLVRLKIHDVYVGSHARERATIIQKKTGLRTAPSRLAFGHTRNHGKHAVAESGTTSVENTKLKEKFVVLLTACPHDGVA